MNDTALHAEATNDVRPPSSLNPLDHAHLALLHERQLRTTAQMEVLAMQHAAVTKERDANAAELNALNLDLRARYAFVGNESVDLKTGAITRP